MTYENRILIVADCRVHNMASFRRAVHWRGRTISSGFKGFEPQRS
jgi:hypothetical protein